MKTIPCLPENAQKFLLWLSERGGIAVWQNCDLGSPHTGCETYTPANTDGKPTVSPHWSNGNTPTHIITDAAQVIVQNFAEAARVKVRHGSSCYGGVHRLDRAKLEAAMAKAGEGAGWTPDYDNSKPGSPWFEAVVSIPVGQHPLSQHLK